MSFKLLILGSNSSLPAYGRHHTSQYLNICNQHFLIDCGDGTQYQILKYKVKVSKIENIFISHLHGDHYLGLMGILFSQHLTGREKDLNIYGQRGLDEIITTQLKHSGSNLNYRINFIELNPEKIETIFENKQLTVTSFPLTHRIPCCGFLFKEKEKERKINSENIPEGLTHEQFEELKNGNDLFNESGKLMFKNEELTLPPPPSYSYAYCSDTGYNSKLVPIIEESSILYHEATFLRENEVWARKTNHSTAYDAGLIARDAKVKKLLIGHFSARYKDLQPFVDEGRLAFSNIETAIEGKTYSPE